MKYIKKAELFSKRKATVESQPTKWSSSATELTSPERVVFLHQGEIHRPT